MEKKINVDYGTDMDLKAIELRMRTDRIHSGFLFAWEDSRLLQILCLFVESDVVQRDRPTWQKFAEQLGLTRQKILCIENEYKYSHGSVWWVLLAFSNEDDATIGRIILILQQLKMFHVILEISNDVLELVDCLSDHLNSQGTKSTILRPPNIPWTPLIFRSLNSRIERVPQIIDITVRGSSMPSIPSAVKIMLTFADDGMEAALRLTEIFRSNEPRIAVLLLREQQMHVFNAAKEFIDDCLKRVDYIIPIATKGYYDVINNTYPEGRDQLVSSFASDQTYAQYVYKCFAEEYVRNRCRNMRVRAIIPSETTENDLPAHLTCMGPTRFKEAEIREFVTMLLRVRRI
ncbi:uncharacterized protein LOC107226736 [Neodiprion lecontei]|uniref:Uncharacterized protein LOC107226736 n=1 Tax=Neodiprion lecontei TaxID=441921 RepID=A0A6J0C715_NEOLC|nr:uncharacterized protein LOC107226736 [Neodiprion lecontei]